MLVICPEGNPEAIVQGSRHLLQCLFAVNLIQLSTLLLAPQSQGVLGTIKLLANEVLQLLVRDRGAHAQSTCGGVVHLHSHHARLW